MGDAARANPTSKSSSTGADSTRRIDSCAYCAKIGATKRCVKRHAKCLKKLFCDEICEKASHKGLLKKTIDENKDHLNQVVDIGDDTIEADDSEAKVAEKALKAKKKKAKKAAAKGKKGSSDQFWWNNSVYASW